MRKEEIIDKKDMKEKRRGKVEKEDMEGDEG